MKHLFRLADDRQEREGGFNHHPVIPSPFETQFQIVRSAVLYSESQDQTAPARLHSTTPPAARTPDRDNSSSTSASPPPVRACSESNTA